VKSLKPIVEVLSENGISLDVIGDPSHPAFSEQREKLITLLREKKISEHQVSAIRDSIPVTADALASVSGHAKESQIASTSALTASQIQAYLIVLRIVEETTSDDVRIEALHATERMNVENNSTLREASAENNLTFKNIAIAVVGGLLLIAGGTVAAKRILS
jgi:hypothetical protein